MKLVVLCSFLVYTKAFVVSPEALQLQVAAIGTKITDTQEAVQEVVHAVGEGVQSAVNTVVDSKNHAQAAATQAVQNGVEAIQSSLSQAAAATGHATGQVAAVVRDAAGKVVEVILLPVKFVGDKVTKKYTLIADGLYKLTHPVPKDEPVPVSAAYQPSPVTVISPDNSPSVPVELVYPSGSYNKHHGTHSYNKPSYVNKDGDYFVNDNFHHTLLTQDGVDFIELPDDWEVISSPELDFYRDNLQNSASEVEETIAKADDPAVEVKSVDESEGASQISLDKGELLKQRN